jgi:23S rRNA U2552 (ribose-2'-O)-methylase RlmE/FtsJ
MSALGKIPPLWSMIKWSSSPRNHPLKVDGDAFMSEQPWEFAAPPDLTSVKDKIAAYDEDIWEFYKKLTNPYELIFTTTGKWATPASVCMLHPLSRSYFKMVEILQVAGVFGRFINQNMRTAHVCEGPGGFIQAVYDQADRARKRVTQTVAMTLKPTENQVPGWKRAVNFLKKNQQIKILYGASGTGDILNAANRESFYGECNGLIHIVTADGGVDFATNYVEQEKTIYPLLVASSVMALKCLIEGGVYVLKIFDSFTRPTEDLILGLGAAFQSWTLYKPATSRPCNSEQYFIGVGYRKGSCATLIQTLESILVHPYLPHKLWTDESFSDSQRSAYRELQIERAAKQVSTIDYTLSLVDTIDADAEKALWETNIKASKEFCTAFHLPAVIQLPVAKVCRPVPVPAPAPAPTSP